jgi:hypothetical protein
MGRGGKSLGYGKWGYGRGMGIRKEGKRKGREGKCVISYGWNGWDVIMHKYFSQNFLIL